MRPHWRYRCTTLCNRGSTLAALEDPFQVGDETRLVRVISQLGAADIGLRFLEDRAEIDIGDIAGLVVRTELIPLYAGQSASLLHHHHATDLFHSLVAEADEEFRKAALRVRASST